MTMKIAWNDGRGGSEWRGCLCLGVLLTHWIPAPASAGVTFFRRNDGVWDLEWRGVVRQAHHERKK